MGPGNKINPRLRDDDTCQRSLDWLQKEVEDWFSANVPDHGHIWLADDDANGLTSRFPPGGKPVEVIFTGSFFLRFLESGLWPFQTFRIWVLSERVKIIFSELFNLPDSEIGVIGRPIKKVIPLGHNFVYPGRLSFTKNITGILYFVSGLQKISPQATLDIYGSFDEFPDESLGRYSPLHLEETVKRLVDELPWTTKPVFHGDVAQKKWLEVKREKPAFISFSTSMYEDYGTAAEIAARAGWPCLLSDWGGHAEAAGYKIPARNLAQSFESAEVHSFKTERLVKSFQEKSFSYSSCNPAFVPEYCSSLGKVQKDFLKKWGAEVLLCLRHKMNVYADTSSGSEFFQHYRHYFSGQTSGKNLLIMNDLVQTPAGLQRQIGEDVEILNFREIFGSCAIKRVHQFETITILGTKEETSKLESFLRTILGQKKEIRKWE